MKKRKSKKESFIDDGRVIANMNVEGMPWYRAMPGKVSHPEGENEPIELTRKEKAAMMSGVMGAALLIAFIFITVFTLFLLFCVFVWFK